MIFLRKLTVLSFLLIGFSLIGLSQNRKAFIGIGAGAGIPTGAFAATNDTYNKSGYANTGFCINLTSYYTLNNWFGLCATASFATNGMNGDQFVKQMYALSSSSRNSRIDKFSQNGCLLAGGYVKKTDFPVYAKAQIGYGFMRTAEITIYNQSGSVTLLQSDATFCFVYSIGAGALFRLSSRWGLTIGADIVHSLAKPDFTILDTQTNLRVTSPEFDYGQNLMTAHIGMGYFFK